ncbi:MAG: lysophospholipid acyltransferase family protein [Luteolibacter sp.]
MIADFGAFLVRLITGVRVMHGLPEASHGRIYYANHSSHLDFVVIWAALDPAARRKTRPAAAADYWEKGPLRRWVAERIFRAILIPRGKVTKAEDPIRKMTAVLDAGEDLIFFPEGTRGDGNRVADFRAGLHALARHRAEAELRPVYLENLNRILPKGEFFLVPLMANALFGEACAPLQTGETKAEFLKRARLVLLECGGVAEVEHRTVTTDESGS